MFIAELSEAVSGHWIGVILTTYICYFLAPAIYNLYFSPLAKYPGPFFAKISALPNWWYSCIGQRHVWTYGLHERYGDIVRTAPNKLLFNSAQAYRDIHGPKANCYKTIFYKAWRRREENVNTLNCTDRSIHSRKRRILNTAFNERSLREAEGYVAWHVGRWGSLLLGESGDRTGVDGEGGENGERNGDGWTKGRNMADQSNHLFFDIMADLSFGKSWDIKEPGKNELRSVPGLIHSFVDFSWVIGTSPLLPLFLYLKPRGLDNLLERFAPESVREYHSFVKSSIETRLQLSSSEADGPEEEVRKDLFHYIINAKDPETGLKYTREEVGAEAGLLIVAGSDTAAVTLSGIFWYLTRRENRGVYDKLCEEIRGAFNTNEEIRLRSAGEGGTGSEGKLGKCVYLKAVIEESLRMCPPISSDLPRITLKGGAEIDGTFVPGDVEVGTSTWGLHFNERYFGDPWKFKPERWIVTEKEGSEGVTEEEVERAKSAFFPFSYGRGDCVGRRLAMMELLVIVGRVVWVMDFEAVEEQEVTDGEGKEKWKGSLLEREKRLYPVKDMFIAKREGPVVRFRERVV